MGMSLATSFVQGIPDFLIGFQEGSRENVKDVARFIRLSPADATAFNDSVLNTSDGRWIPAQYREVILHDSNKTFSIIAGVVYYFLALVYFIVVIVQLVMFIKFIRAVNRSIIFDWSNVIKLRWIGTLMLISFAASAIGRSLHYLDNVANVKISGYTVNTINVWDFNLLILGLGALLMGEIFAIGLRLKEEQDLTI